ncbi:hypothetical protein F4604DRAFT_1675206 [Suillus subluteus]|nr:hypothetical protein F4604DRAFT_1675206 [Suillus subluteus]
MSLTRLKGAAVHLDKSQGISIEAAIKDQDEEVESLLNSFDVNNQAACGALRPIRVTDEAVPLPSKSKKTAARLVDHGQLSSSLETASAGVVVDTTLSDYQQYWNQFKDFCAAIDKVQSASDVDSLLPNLPAEFPTWIALWIMDNNISPYYTSERTCIISRMIRASGPWAEDGLAEVVGYYVDGCTKTSGPTYWYYFVDRWAEGAVKDLLYTGGPTASGFGCQVSIFGTQYLGLGTQWLGLDGWALGVGTQISGFGTQLSGLGFQDSVVRTRWLGLNGWDSIVGLRDSIVRTRWLIVETQNSQLIAMFEFQVLSLESWASGFGS